MPPQHRSADNRRGVAMMIAAITLLSFMDAGLKGLSAHYPALQVTALRALASLPLVVCGVLWRTRGRGLTRLHWKLQALRCVLFIATLTVFITGIRNLPITTTYTIFFIAPLLITVLSALVLGDQVDAHRWIAIAAGFAGVLVALRPTGEGALSWSGLAILAAAAGYASAAIVSRVQGRTDSTEAMTFWMVVVTTPIALALAAPHWTPVDRSHWLLIAGVGTVGAAGQYALTEAFARAESSVIAPIEYTALVWGVGFDVFVWGVLPDALTWLGASIIVASGVYLLRHERRAVAEPQP